MRHAPAIDPESGKFGQEGPVRLELLVRNHPGVMSHVCGLFSRRACNVEGILCLPQEDGTSRIWLVIEEGRPVDQIVKQAEKLEDVLRVTLAPATAEALERARAFFAA
jgi:acetolactate synthase-1/3 small subunit